MLVTCCVMPQAAEAPEQDDLSDMDLSNPDTRDEETR